MRKYPEDFEDWIPVDGYQTILGGNYLVLDSPDGKEQICVHLQDGHVLGILDKATMKYGDERPELSLIHAMIKTEKLLEAAYTKWPKLIRYPRRR